jgi:DNA-directed RNA polymerase subunit M/transcription elongation factor TFIIS
MPDIATIGAALSSLKTATDIVKFLRETDVTLEKAELKMKLADLMGSLADTKIELIEVQETLADKDKKINELEEAFNDKDSVVRQYDAYYKSDANGKPTGVPLCLRCWESEHKQRQLVHSVKEYRFRVCTSCGHQYEGRLAGEIHPQTNQQPAQA